MEVCYELMLRVHLCSGDSLQFPLEYKTQLTKMETGWRLKQHVSVMNVTKLLEGPGVPFILDLEPPRWYNSWGLQTMCINRNTTLQVGTQCGLFLSSPWWLLYFFQRTNLKTWGDFEKITNSGEILYLRGRNILLRTRADKHKKETFQAFYSHLSTQDFKSLKSQ